MVVAVAAGLLPAVLGARISPAHAAASGNTADARGYWLTAADGGIFAFGDAPFLGSMGGTHLNKPIVGTAATHNRGYWLVATDGGIFSFGDAGFFGSTGGTHLNKPILGMAPTLSDQGYWLVASDGGVFAFGDAPFLGSMGGTRLNQPIVGMTPSPTGNGYWMVASDGGIFTFGDAKFFGSTGNIHLNKPIVGMAATPSGRGYWLVASDGGIFTFGDAAFFGSAGGIPLARPIVGMSRSPSGNGYWLVASDGGIFSYGDANFAGSTGNIRLNSPIVSMAAMQARHGAETVAFYYPWYGTPDRDGSWVHWDQNGASPPDNIASNYYPTRGPYSSSDTSILDAHFTEIAAAGITEVVVSWWGRNSYEDQHLAAVTNAAAAHGVGVGIQIEPYGGRDASTLTADLATLTGQGYKDFWVYFANQMPADQLAVINDGAGSGVRTWASSTGIADVRDGRFQDFARDAHFTGIYTYDPYFFEGGDFPVVCGQAHQRGLACAAGVAPGFFGVRATNIQRVKERANGATYDQRWAGAIGGGADVAAIVSYNEWHEGSQIESTAPAGCHSFSDTCYAGFDGAYGVSGPAASTVYLDRTKFWSDRYRATGG